MAARMMLVTIITVAYNMRDTIARTVESVLNQSYPNIEYIIIDGMSTDGTAEAAKAYQPRFDKKKGRSLTVISEPDKGMYDALNKGARMAHGELIGQINADDWYELTAVASMAKAYLKTHYDLAWGNIHIYKPSGLMKKKARLPGRFFTTAGWCHPASFSRKDTLLGFPYALESMYDDFDYLANLYVNGKKLLTVNRDISNFTFGGMSTRKHLQEVIKRVGSRYRIYRKYGFGRGYLFHCIAIEYAKYLLG